MPLTPRWTLDTSYLRSLVVEVTKRIRTRSTAQDAPAAAAV